MLVVCTNNGYLLLGKARSYFTELGSKYRPEEQLIRDAVEGQLITLVLYNLLYVRQNVRKSHTRVMSKTININKLLIQFYHLS